ncbi:sugar transferase [Ottowia sp.]|uniref:sugar transferase n=1 Tax=Ottowia sp. TaxID=1898956 RepID=UPI003419D90C
MNRSEVIGGSSRVLWKRIMDVTLTVIALPVVLPLMLCIGLWVKADSPGPALFRQQRVGQGGRMFNILKFRTMRAGSAEQGPAVTAAGDARITRAGAWLRRTKLDELPQLLNVLRGEMSLVGPRPEVPRYMALYEPAVRERILSVRPGITDLAALEFRDEERLLAAAPDVERAYVEQILPVKQRYYLDYVARHSVGGDVRILIKTLGALLGVGRGS